MQDKDIYLPGLNGIRCVAALTVIFVHIEVYKKLVGIPNFYYITPYGSKAVNLFFVLSGFLITYLLLLELKSTSTIDLKKFYTRRILRIWPLYFFAVAFGFFVLPAFLPFEPWDKRLYSEFYYHLAAYALMVPNVMYYFSGPIPFIDVLWSIGVEEQFYLVWPLLMRRFKARLPLLLCAIVAVFVVVRILLLLYSAEPLRSHGTFAAFFRGLQFECLAIGGIGAWLAINKKEWLKIIFRRDVQLLNIAAALFLIGARYKFSFMEYAVYGAMFTIFILNVSCNPSSILKLENRVFNFLGKISYGMYVYHSAALVLMLTLLPGLDMSFQNFNILLYAGTIALTILIASVSYLYFERWFIQLKKRYEIIKISSTAGI